MLPFATPAHGKIKLAYALKINGYMCSVIDGNERKH
jgi:hypothetical protein